MSTHVTWQLSPVRRNYVFSATPHLRRGAASLEFHTSPMRIKSTLIIFLIYYDAIMSVCRHTSVFACVLFPPYRIEYADIIQPIS